MASGAGEREEVGRASAARSVELRLRRPSPSHRHDDEVVLGGEETRDMARDRGLPDALAGAVDRERRQRERREARRVEAEVRAGVREARGEQPAREQDRARRPEDRLVREVDDQLRRAAARAAASRDERNAVLLPAAELLRPADHQRPAKS